MCVGVFVCMSENVCICNVCACGGVVCVCFCGGIFMCVFGVCVVHVCLGVVCVCVYV